MDNQFPAALARFLTTCGHDAQHVLDLQMDETDDPDIWSHAVAQGRALVSKDEDFLHLANRPGATGASCGCASATAASKSSSPLFDHALPALVTALEEGHRVVEVR